MSAIGKSPGNQRSKVSSILQGQLQDLVFYRNDYENMKSRLILAENSLSMKEAQFKLFLEELQTKNSKLKLENEHLHETISSKAASEDAITMKKKYLKWKARSKSQLRENQSSEIISQIQNENSILKEESNILRQTIEAMSGERDSAAASVKAAAQESSKLKETVKMLSKSVSNLKTENANLQTEKKEKAELLAYARQSEAAKSEQSQSLIESAEYQAELPKKRCIFLEGELSKSQIMLQNEKKEKQKLERLLKKLRNEVDTSAEKSAIEIRSLSTQNSNLKVRLNDSEGSESSMELELVALRTKEAELENEVKRAGKLQKVNHALSLKVQDLESSVSDLQRNISSLEIPQKENELRELLMKNASDIPEEIGWKDMLKRVDSTLYSLGCIEKENMKLKEKLQRKKQKLEAARQEAKTASVEREPVHEEEEEGPDFSQMNSIRSSVFKKIDSCFSKNQKCLSDIFQMCEGRDAQTVSLRAIFLFGIAIKKWLSFKKTDNLDASMLTEYAGATMKGQLTDTVTSKLRELFQNSDRESKELHKAIEGKDKEIAGLNEEMKDLRRRIEDSEKKYEESVKSSRDEIKISGEQLRDQKNSFDASENGRKQKEAEVEALKSQLGSIKTEYLRLIEACEKTTGKGDEAESRIQKMIVEREEVKQKLRGAEDEIKKLRSALNGKTKEILCLEKRAV